MKSNTIGQKISKMLLLLLFAVTCTAPWALASPAPLTGDDLTYQGIVRMAPSVFGMAAAGLAYRESTGTFFAIARNGGRPYHLVEFRMVKPSRSLSTAPDVEVVRDWGNIDDPKHPRIGKSSYALFARGLYYDNAANKLWMTVCNTYVQSPNYPAILYLTLNDHKGTLEVHGPWRMAVSSYNPHGAVTAAGTIFPLPKEVSDALGGKGKYPFGLYRSRENGATGPWGASIVAVEDPSTLAPWKSESDPGDPAANVEIIFYRSETTYPDGRKDFLHSFVHSEFPRAPGDPIPYQISGQGLVGVMHKGTVASATATTMTLDSTDVAKKPWSAKVSEPCGTGVVEHQWLIMSEQNSDGTFPTGAQMTRIVKVDDSDLDAVKVTVDPPFSPVPPAGSRYYRWRSTCTDGTAVTKTTLQYQQRDDVNVGGWLATPEREGFYYLGYYVVGAEWYGYDQSLYDQTPDGLKYHGKFMSFLDPTKPITNLYGLSDAKGGHGEKFNLHTYFYASSDVASLAKKVADGTADTKDKELPPSSFANTAKMGGDVQLGRATGTMDKGAANHYVMRAMGSVFVPDSRMLYVLVYNCENNPDIQAWSVR